MYYSLQHFKILLCLLFFSSCINDTSKNKTNISTNEKFYKVENINENDIISNPIDQYDADKMVFIEGGKFKFGSDNGLNRESPEHEVIIQSFLIDKNLVTVEDFRTYVNKSNYIKLANKAARIQINELKKIKKVFNKSFIRAVELIMNWKC